MTARPTLPEPSLKIGIEHEFVFSDENGRYLDGDNASYELFSGIVEQIRVFDGDDAYLACKSLETFPRRCYVEGFELHDADGNIVETIPKGLEIRTIPHNDIEELVREFRATFADVLGTARRAGLRPLLTSRHPFKETLQLDDRIGAAEQKVRSTDRLALAKRAMLSHGLHVNLSIGAWPAEKMQDALEKLNYYLPSLIPWSFSSPFHGGKAFQGLCARNYYRAGTRSMAGLEERKGALVLEFRAFDAPGDALLLSDLLRLFCGFVLDERLPGRAPVQDSDRLMRSSLAGFGDSEFRDEGRTILQAADDALGGSGSFGLLEEMLERNDSWSSRIKACHAQSGDILACITDRYDF